MRGSASTWARAVADFILGYLFGSVICWAIYNLAPVARLFDRLYQFVLRLPDCTPGSCYCRRGCVHMMADEVSGD